MRDESESIGERLSRLERKVRSLEGWDLSIGRLIHKIRDLEDEFYDLTNDVRRLEPQPTKRKHRR
jgi:hypothetical protein